MLYNYSILVLLQFPECHHYLQIRTYQEPNQPIIGKKTLQNIRTCSS